VATSSAAEAPPVLVLAPTGRDGQVARTILADVGLTATICPDARSFSASLADGSCAVVTEEGLLSADREELAAWVRRQPPWSDFPFVLLTVRGERPSQHLLEMLGNVTVLERPFHPEVLVSAVRSGMRARQRQREVEAHLVERQRTYERQSLLIRELHHRVKNTLATVQALLGATARSTESMDEFYESFTNRIASLARTHDLLTEDFWQTAELKHLLEKELAPFHDEDGRRIVLAGPQVELSAELAVPTGMAIHELTINAAKYGALSVPTGVVEIAWDVRELDPGRSLHFTWTERDGPRVVKPNRKGFGSTLLQRVLKLQCKAEIDVDYAPEGLRFEMVAPLQAARAGPEG
jgi:two-component sensor histidine kinase